MPGCRVEYAPDAGPDKRNYRVDCNKIKLVLPSFQPTWDARQGALELYEAYQKVGITLEEFEGPKYKRIDHLKQLIRTGKIDETLRWKQ